MDRRLNSYNGKCLYEVGFNVWFVKPAADLLRDKPEDVILQGRITSISISEDDVQFWIQAEQQFLVPCEYVHDSEKFAKQFCIGRAIELADKKIKTLEGDVDYTLSQIRVYTEKRDKFYQQLREVCDE